MTDFVEVQTGPSPCLSVIWLHGLGADGHDFEPIVEFLDMSPEWPIRYVFPHAPKRRVSVNFGMVMRAWYDIYDPTIAGHGKEDLEGLQDSANIVNQLIVQELRHVNEYGRIVLAGFSQGGAVALYSGLRYPEALGGIFALSSYLPSRETTRIEVSDANRKTPILIRHGSLDPVITASNAEVSYEVLRELGYSIDWKTYLVPHTVSAEICRDIGV